MCLKKKYRAHLIRIIDFFHSCIKISSTSSHPVMNFQACYWNRFCQQHCTRITFTSRSIYRSVFYVEGEWIMHLCCVQKNLFAVSVCIKFTCNWNYCLIYLQAFPHAAFSAVYFWVKFEWRHICLCAMEQPYFKNHIPFIALPTSEGIGKQWGLLFYNPGQTVVSFFSSRLVWGYILLQLQVQSIKWVRLALLTGLI